MLTYDDICSNNLEAILRYLKSQEFKKAIGRCEEPYLFEEAIRFGTTEVVKKYIEYGANVNFSKGTQRTYLLTAVKSGKDKMVKMLLAHGAKINNSIYDEYNPLVQACYNNNTQIVKMLLAHGADPRAGSTLDDDIFCKYTTSSGERKIMEEINPEIVKFLEIANVVKKICSMHSNLDIEMLNDLNEQGQELFTTIFEKRLDYSEFSREAHVGRAYVNDYPPIFFIEQSIKKVEGFISAERLNRIESAIKPIKDELIENIAVYEGVIISMLYEGVSPVPFYHLLNQRVFSLDVSKETQDFYERHPEYINPGFFLRDLFKDESSAMYKTFLERASGSVELREYFDYWKQNPKGLEYLVYAKVVCKLDGDIKKFLDKKISDVQIGSNETTFTHDPASLTVNASIQVDEGLKGLCQSIASNPVPSNMIRLAPGAALIANAPVVVENLVIGQGATVEGWQNVTVLGGVVFE